jgi:CelD/BcsL family acetyltransferase involved in cellulose biosynthesis
MNSPARSRASEQQILLVDPLSDPCWLSLVQDQESLLFHSPAWLKVISETYEFDVKALVLLEQGRPLAGIPFVLIEDALGRRLVSLAFSDYCDPVFQKRSQINALLRRLIDIYPEHQVKLRFRSAPDPAVRLGFATVKTARWHGVWLDGSEQELYRRLDPKFRYDLRQAEKRGLSVRELKKTELRRFFEMQLAVRKNRYRLLAQPFHFFENVWKVFVRTRQGFFLGAYTDEGRLIAAYCLLCWKDTLVHKFGASDYDYSDARANHLLHWKTINIGLSRGLRLLDLGLSDDDQLGLIRYKRRLGSEEKAINFYARTRIKSPAEALALGSTLSEITRLATGPEVPDPVTEKFGNLLYRYFA